MDPPDRQREAREVLDRVARESEVVGRSLARRAAHHFAGRDTERRDIGPPDPAELWGRRVGRALSVLVCLALVWWLGVQLHWWPAP